MTAALNLSRDEALAVAASAPEGSESAECARINADWFLVDESGELSVCRWVRDETTGRDRLVRYSPAAFRLKLADRRVDGKPLADAWLAWAGRRSYDRVTFDPGTKATPPDVLNLWRGWAVRPVPHARYDAIEAHLFSVLCGEDPALFDYLVSWMARMVQRPAEPAGVAVVLRGKEGVGKSIVGRLLRRIAGQHGLAVSSPKAIVGDFNAMLEDAVFVEASEALFAGDRAVASRLKALVTDDTLTIERKGVDAREARNHVHLLMTSNEDWVVPAGPESRRYLVLDVSDAHRGDADYFAALASEIDSDEAVGGFLYDLLARDLSRFNHRAVPTTAALVSQRERSLTGVLAWACDLASRGVVRTERGAMPWRGFFSTRELFEDFREWASGQRFERALSVNVFARDVRQHLGLVWQRRPKADQPVPEHAQGVPGFSMPETVAAFDRLVRERAGLIPTDDDQAEGDA